MLCPCHSDLLYEECCKPFHEETQFPATPLELMRSRYAAFALNLPDYIIKTMAKSHPNYDSNLDLFRESITHFSLTTDFEGLEILSTSQSGDTGIVTFKAILKSDGNDISFIEESFFIRKNGKWIYHSGKKKTL